MRVLLITQHFDILGGSDVIVHLTKRLLEEKGHTVFLFAANTQSLNQSADRFPSGSHFEKPNITNISKFYFSKEARDKLTIFLKENPVDIAHLHIYYGTLSPSILKPLKNFLV